MLKQGPGTNSARVVQTSPFGYQFIMFLLGGVMMKGDIQIRSPVLWVDMDLQCACRSLWDCMITMAPYERMWGG